MAKTKTRWMATSRVTERDWRRLRARLAKQGRTLSDWLAERIQEELRRG